MKIGRTLLIFLFCLIPIMVYARSKITNFQIGDFSIDKRTFDTGGIEYYIVFVPRKHWDMSVFSSIKVPFEYVNIFTLDNSSNSIQEFDTKILSQMKTLCGLKLKNVSIHKNIKGIELSSEIDFIELVDTDIVDEDCSVFAKLGKLHQLKINGEKIKGAGLGYFCKDAIGEVDLSESYIDDSAFKALATYKNLEVVKMHNLKLLNRKQIAEYYHQYLEKKNVRIYYQNEENQ